jgi:predicted ATP-grasp superfamily ATP-dependent carboligase
VSDGLQWEERPAGLRRPVLVAAFEGWNDAGDAASNAAAWLVEHSDSSRFASIDPEEHFDFQSRRPEVELIDGITRRIQWPENVFYAAHLGERDVVVMRGIEPSYRWRSFCRAVLEVGAVTNCEMVVALGALLADVPHTRRVSITGTASDRTLVDRLGLSQSRYEGPTGIVGVLHDAAREAGVPSVSLWAPVPHYVSTPPNPPATLSLLERLGEVTGTSLELDSLAQSAVTWRERIDEIAEGDKEVSAYVEKLEERFDAERAEASSWIDELPNGDELAAELERFLRDQRGNT